MDVYPMHLCAISFRARRIFSCLHVTEHTHLKVWVHVCQQLHVEFWDRFLMMLFHWLSTTQFDVCCVSNKWDANPTKDSSTMKRGWKRIDNIQNDFTTSMRNTWTSNNQNLLIWRSSFLQLQPTSNHTPTHTHKPALSRQPNQQQQQHLWIANTNGL